MEIGRVACMDKLLQIYFLGLKICSMAMSPPICGPEIPPKIINQQVKYFVPLLIEKIEELNYRARDLSHQNLISIFRHPAVDIRILIEGIMDITEKGKPPDKVEWRKVHSRLEILKHVVDEFKVNDRAWDWRIVFQKLVQPAFFHQNNDVRLMAIELTTTLYKITGNELRNMVMGIENIKPNLLHLIQQRFDEIDAEVGSKYVVGHN